MLKAKRPIDTCYNFMMSKVWVLLCANKYCITGGNLAETGLIAFMIRNFQLSTYLKVNCWKPHKVPSTIASSNKSMHTCCLLIALCNFFLLIFSYFFVVLLLACGFQQHQLFLFFSFLSPNTPLYFSPSIFLGIPFVFENQASQFYIIYINIYTINLW